MAVKIWTGATSGDLGVATNFSPNGVLVDDDELHFVKEFLVAVTAGLDLSGGAGIHLKTVQSEEGFTSAVGGSGSPLICTCDRLVWRGIGILWFKDGSGTNDTWTKEILIDAPKLDANVANLDGAAIERILLTRGRTEILGSTGAIGKLQVGYRNAPLNDVKCNVVATAGAIGTLIVNGAAEVTTRDSQINLVVCNSGRWTHTKGDIGILYNDGANVIFNPQESDGVLYQAHLQSGTLDTLQTARAKRIRFLSRMQGAIFLRDENLTVPDVVEYMGNLVED